MASSDSQKNIPRGNNRAALFIVGALALAGLAYAIARVDILRARITALQVSTQGIQQGNQQLQTQVVTLLQTRTRSSEQLQQLQTELTSLKQQLGDARNGLAPVQQQWARIEALYLLRLTQDQLQLARDVPLAMQTLAVAVNTLANDSELPALRQQLQQQLEQLRALPMAEYARSEQTLQRAAQQLRQLPLRPLTPETAAPAADSSRAWAAIKRGVGSLIRIRASDTAATLSADVVVLGRSHAHALLIEARLALRSHDQAKYQSALTQAQPVITALFDSQSPQVQDLLQQLQQLAQLNIAPALPDFSRSMQTLSSAVPAALSMSANSGVPESTGP